MNVLMIGDVVKENGCRFLMKTLPAYKKFAGIDLCVINGENSAESNGITPESADMLFAAGADVITTGNHVYKRSEIYDYLETEPFILRPANYPENNPGKGVCIVDRGAYRAAVVNLSGICFMEPLANPFYLADKIIKELEADGVKVIIVDFHGEATSEKRAMGFYLDGRVSVIAGTHTHVQTSDASVLTKGTGYITDLGMTGSADSVLGIKPDIVIQKLKTAMPVRFVGVDGPCKTEGCIFNVNEKTGKCENAQSIRIF